MEKSAIGLPYLLGGLAGLGGLGALGYGGYKLMEANPELMGEAAGTASNAKLKLMQLLGLSPTEAGVQAGPQEGPQEFPAWQLGAIKDFERKLRNRSESPVDLKPFSLRPQM